MLAETTMSKRARAISASFFNRDRTGTSPTTSPTPPSPTKPLGADTFPSNHATPPTDSPAPVTPARRMSQSRPQSVINPFMMSNGASPTAAVSSEDILPEMVGVFRYLSEHAQKVYHEGYFQKLNDMNPDGSAVTNREWTDCYAQLIGSVLTIWDDRVIQEEEERTRRGYPPEASAVKPAFLNLTDASMKMIDSLPQRANGAPLKNVLSVSTAGRNRYLLHFGSALELTQWTAAIRLAMFEHNCLQEAYTGALIAAKGRSLNSISSILERSKFKVEDWTRVRFGAGTPWKRYWTVITPPDEKAFQKAKKAAKKASKQMGAQIQMEAVMGDIKFFENSKPKKKTLPVATISGAYAAYAVYPEAKALIDQSTLIKIEGSIVIHSDPPFSSEGIIFMMPDHHAAVSGFEMMLRFLIPTFDIFNLYGRPNKLVGDSIDPRSLMFAFPKEPRAQYRLLETSDIVGIINESGSHGWAESEWRRKLKQATSKVQLSGRGLQRANLTSPSTASLPTQLKLGGSSSLTFDTQQNGGRNSMSSQRPPLPTIQSGYGQNGEIPESHSAPPQMHHSRSLSEAQATQFYPQQPYQTQPPQHSLPQPPPPPPPPHQAVGQAYGAPPTGYQQAQQNAPLPQGYSNGYNSHPNSRPPSSKSQRSQRSQMSQRSGQVPPPSGYRQPPPPPQAPSPQGGPPSAYRGDPRAAGGYDPSRQPPQLQTSNLAPAYPMPSPSPNSSRAAPVPAHSFSPVANARAMSRLSIGTLEMMHGTHSGPVSDQYYGQTQSPTLGVHADGTTGAHRTASYGSASTSTESDLSNSSRDSDLVAPRPTYTTQGHKVSGSNASITPATGAIASRIPKGHDIHSDPEDFNVADELHRKQMEAAAFNAAKGGVPHPQAHAPFPQHGLPQASGFEQHPLPPVPVDQGYNRGYGNGQDGSAPSSTTTTTTSRVAASGLHINTAAATAPAKALAGSNGAHKPTIQTVLSRRKPTPRATDRSAPPSCGPAMTDSDGIVASDINNTYPDIATLTTATTTTEDNLDRGPASSSNINKNSNIARRLENNIVHESPTAKLHINTKIPTDDATAASATAPSTTLTTTSTTAADKSNSNSNSNVNDKSGNIVRTPSSADSVAQKILLIDSDVFNRIASSPSRRRKPVGSSSGPASPSPRSPLGPKYLSNRLSKGKGIARMDSVLTRASVYSNDDDDGNDTASNYSYASSTVQSPVESASKPVFWGGNKKEPELDEDGFPRRTGAKKYVGQPTEEMMEVMIGETKYSVNKVAGHEQRTSGNWDDEHRPRSGGSSSGGAPLRSSSAAGDGDDGSNRSSGVVFLGHGRGLSVGGVEVDFGPTASLSGALGSSPSPSSSSKPVTPQSKQQQQQHSRPGSGTSNIAEGSGGHSNANGMRRRSIAWSPGMVNFTNQQVAKDYNYNSASDGGDEQSLDQQPQEKQPTPQPRQQTTPPKPVQGILPPPRGSSYQHQEKKEGSEEEFDAQSFVTAHVAIAQQKQQQDEAMRQKFLRDQFQHHRSASSSSNLLANVLGAGMAAGGAASGVAGYTPDQRNSRSPSSDPEQQQNNGVKLPGGHSRNASSATLPHISRQPSTDLLNGGGSGSNSPIHKQASRMASRELLNARPHSRGNMLNVERPVAVPNVNTSTTAALHSLPPPVTYHQASAPVIPNHQRMNSAFSVPGHGKLSAGEQEYIARSMGAPLLGQNLNTETQKQAPPHAAGLLGVMERRDKERREYRSSMAVKQVLRTRGSILGLNAFPTGQPQPLVQAQMTPRMQTPVPQQQVQHPMQPMIQTQFQPQMQLPMQQQQPAMTAYGAQQSAFGFGGQHMGQPVQQHYGFYGHQPQQGSTPQNSHQQQLAMVMQQQQQLQQQLQQQQMAMMQQRQMDMMQQQLNSMGMNGMNMQGQRQVSSAWRYG
ncbi:hypothetical protein H072_6768 [Dactylellina haptotyla CBS 200.50]|uniref:PH domain-containing protein n=1 Tax=Dactylellina haptotyla (strain CBS 200.50) TaxID=1284197 RepID=S8AE98_DACHA|nr:hypothetical protein H072_6768 [Dactylellina haptotyla CBS 200.50]